LGLVVHTTKDGFDVGDGERGKLLVDKSRVRATVRLTQAAIVAEDLLRNVRFDIDERGEYKGR